MEVLCLDGARLRTAIEDFPETRAKFEKLAGDRLAELQHSTFNNLGMFADCSERMRFLMDIFAERRIFFPGNRIFTKGDVVEGVGVIFHGTVIVSDIPRKRGGTDSSSDNSSSSSDGDDDGKPRTIELGPGDWVGAAEASGFCDRAFYTVDR